MAGFKSHSDLCENVWQMCCCGDGEVARGHGVKSSSSSGSYSRRLLWRRRKLPCYTDLGPVVSTSPVKVNRHEWEGACLGTASRYICGQTWMRRIKER